MNIRIIKLTFVLIIIMATAMFVVRTYFSAINSVSYKIFKAEKDGYYFHKVLGIVPKPYQDRYIESTLDLYGGKELVNLIDQKGAGHPNFIFVRDVKSGVKFLKAYPFELVGVSDELVEEKGWEKHVSLLIDLEVFNDYLQDKHLTSREEVIDKYSYFLSNPTNRNSYKILRDSSSLNTLISENPLVNKDYIKSAGYKLIDPKDINFSQASETTVYCWIYTKGVVKFVFILNDDNTLKSVDSEIIGFLGNETPTI